MDLSPLASQGDSPMFTAKMLCLQRNLSALEIGTALWTIDGQPSARCRSNSRTSSVVFIEQNFGPHMLQ